MKSWDLFKTSPYYIALGYKGLPNNILFGGGVAATNGGGGAGGGSEGGVLRWKELVSGN